MAEQYVYAVRELPDGPVKIGFATNVRHRVSTLQTGNSSDLKLIWMTRGSGNLERKIHMRLAKFWTRGEWFDFGDVESERLALMLDVLAKSPLMTRIDEIPLNLPPID